jgi:hypothetical protein
MVFFPLSAIPEPIGTLLGLRFFGLSLLIASLAARNSILAVPVTPL